MPSREPQATHRASIKETITQLVIAFVMAFVFRGFVIEAFLIPTGSMAPTLMGAHMRFTGKASGYQWDVGPWEAGSGPSGDPPALQGTQMDPVIVNDPMTWDEFRGIQVPTLGGDRIFVLKYLPSIFDPQRFDCVVFKNPANPDVNYIKRLVGLPGEQVALIAGDVFVRSAGGTDARAEDWFAPGWHIARKPERVQQSLWMPVFSSEFAPVMLSAGDYWEPPWVGTRGFEVGIAPTYRCTSSDGGVLSWNAATNPIEDYCPYNQSRPHVGPRGYGAAKYFVPDIRLRAGLRPEASGVVASAIVVANGHEFRADIDGTRVSVRRRQVPMPDGLGVAEPGAWTDLGSGTLASALPVGEVTDVEFWHVDQSVRVIVGGREVVYAEYDWTPRERILHATGRPLDTLLENQESAWDAVAALLNNGGMFNPSSVEHRRAVNIFTARDEYRAATARWEFSGPVTMSRVGLDRDLYYQPNVYSSVDPETGRAHPRARQAAMATHPSQPALLRPNQFFVCGDNSAASLDARLWGEPDPWVAATIDSTIGVVPRDLMIGKAFFVYFPAMHRDRPVPVVDFGRMRFIW